MTRTPFLQRLLLHVSILALTVSGVAWAVMKHLLAPVDEYSAAGHPLQPWAVALHVLAAWCALFGIGWIFREHIAGRFGRPRGTPARFSGTGAALVLAPLVATGVALQLITNETARPLLGWAHLALGIVFALVYAGHFFVSRRFVREIGFGSDPGSARENGSALDGSTRENRLTRERDSRRDPAVRHGSVHRPQALPATEQHQ